METTGVCEIDVASRRIVGGSDSPPDLDSPSQVNIVSMSSFCVWYFVIALLFVLLLPSVAMNNATKWPKRVCCLVIRGCKLHGSHFCISNVVESKNILSFNACPQSNITLNDGTDMSIQ